MNDRRFKELLNLYLDHRLSPDEAKELEQALKVDAARRKLLRDYSLIQGGCSELFSRTAARAPSSATLCRSLKKVEKRISRVTPSEVESGSVWRGWTLGFGVTGLGIAACATILVATRVGDSPDAAPDTASKSSVERMAPLSVAVNELPKVSETLNASLPGNIASEPVSERQRARNLTLAALGLTMDETAVERSGKQWADVRETYELANLSPAARNWIKNTTAYEAGWTQNQQSSLSMQSSGGYTWNEGTSGGYQVQAAAYRFER